MYEDQLKPGTKVMIQKPGDAPNEGYVCKVEALYEQEKQVIITAPIQGGRIVLLDKGKYVLRLLNDAGSIVYKSELIARHKIDGIEMVIFSLEDGGEKIQRRSTFRLNIAMRASFSVIYTNGQQSDKEESLIIDLSVGGAKIYTNKKLNLGYLLSIEMQLDDHLMVVFGDVRTNLKLPRESKYGYQYGIRFVMMPQEDQDRIIKFIYKMQRQDLKKIRIR